jgi:DNA-binding CsgD family transcriptional regulator
MSRRPWTPPVGARLTKRQVDYLRRTANGESWQQIGRALGLTLGGVGSLSKQVLAKLGANSAAHAVHLAHEAGLLDDRLPRAVIAQPQRKPGSTPDDARRIAARLEAGWHPRT